MGPFKRVRDISNSMASVGGEKAPRIDKLVEMFKVKQDKFYEIRLIGPIFSYAYHWFETTKKDGGTAKFTKQCLAWDDETESLNSEINALTARLTLRVNLRFTITRMLLTANSRNVSRLTLQLQRRSANLVSRTLIRIAGLRFVYSVFPQVPLVHYGTCPSLISMVQKATRSHTPLQMKSMDVTLFTNTRRAKKALLNINAKKETPHR